MLIAARRAFRDDGAVDAGLPEPYRMVSAEFPDFRLVGIYMPNLLVKVPYWQALIAFLQSERSRPALAVGDYNTCRPYLDEAGAIDRTALYMDKIAEIGLCDLWRQRNPDLREYSWFSTRGNGFRIDHAFLTRNARRPHRHDPLLAYERLAGLSDHSPLILDLGI